MRSTFTKVAEFHNVFELLAGVPGAIYDEHLMKLRVRLIAEEFAELLEALGIVDSEGSASHTLSLEDLINGDVVFVGGPNLVEVADALGDLDYVVAGTSHVLGLPHDTIVSVIHESNMSKLGEDGRPIKDEGGKIQKGPNYYPPTEGIERLVNDVLGVRRQLDESVPPGHRMHNAH